MNNNVERDTKKSLDRLSTVSSSSTSRGFDMLDNSAKKLSDWRESYQDNKGAEENLNNEEETSSRLKTAENNLNNTDISAKTTESTTSRLKTNINNEKDSIDTEEIEESTPEGELPKKSKLKTGVEKIAQKTFKFNENQGKISKSVTVVSKVGKGVSKVEKKITRTSRELNKAISNDGTGKDYLNDKVGRKLKTKAGKITKKATKKITSPIKKKFQQTIGKKLIQVAKTVILKLLKILMSLFVSIAEFIIPAALVILIIVAIGSIFGSGSSKKDIDNYSTYMTNIQNEYNKQVDDWVKNNPDGIVVGVKGNYGQIDWRIPLAIMQSTGAELKYDQSEKDLLESFKNANLYEKHEEVKQKVDREENGETVEKEIPVLVITNSVYEDYIEWCKNNYSKIASFNKSKGITNGSDTWFSNDQLDMLEMLYQSDDYAELLGSDFKTRTPSYGKNEGSANLKGESYNSKNTLATSGFKGQCTWYSFGRALELFNKKMPTGNAQTWLSSAIAMGYQTGTQPSYNSVVVLMGHKFGHVAYVEAYDGKTITISEGNVGNKCSSDDSCSQVEYANEHAEELVRTKTYSSFDAYRKASKSSGLTVVGFIYLN